MPGEQGHGFGGGILLGRGPHARVIPAALASGTLPSFQDPVDVPQPTISAPDLGLISAKLLLRPSSGNEVDVIHAEGPRRYSASDVAAAHQKDLAVQSKYGVNFLNYWVDEKAGTVFCLAQAPDSNALIMTHKEAHGLIPKSVKEVQQGQ